jgi:excisionase family DNA binding protein
MTADEVADYLTLTKAKVYRLSQRGVIPAYKFGREWRFRKERIDQWIEEQETGKKKK